MKTQLRIASQGYAYKNQLKHALFRDIVIIGFGLIPPPLLNWLRIISNLNIYLGNLFVLKYFAYCLIIDAKK